MRIAIVIARFPDPTSSFTVTRARALASTGMDIGIFYRNEGNNQFLRTPLFASMLKSGVRTYRFSSGIGAAHPFFALLRSFASIRSIEQMFEYIRKAQADGYSIRNALSLYCSIDQLVRWEPDIVHIDVSYLALGLVGPLALTKRPIIVSLRGADVDEKPYLSDRWKQWFRESGHFENLKFHCVSNYVRSKAINWEVNPSRSVVIYQGIDSADFEAVSDSHQDECKHRGLIVVARLSKEKGVDVALKALSLLPEEDLHLHVIGDGEEMDALTKLAGNLGIQERIFFHGEKSNDWVKTFLVRNRNNHLYVQPSMYEAFGQAILEAMAAGIPLIASRIGGVPELVVEGETGLLFEMGSAKSLASRLADLLQHRDLAGRLAAQAKIRAIKEFSVAREASQFRELYLSCLKESGGLITDPSLQTIKM